MYRSKVFMLSLLLTVNCIALLAPGASAWQTTFMDNTGRADAVVVDARGDVIATGAILQGSDVIKLSGTTGEVLWRFNASNYESRTYAQALAVDSDGNVFVVFVWSRVVLKISGATGTLLWSGTIGGTLNAFLPLINAVTVDGEGNVITAGTVGGLFNVCKLRGTDGTEMWHYEREGLAKAVAVGPSGDVAAAGLMSSNFAVVKLEGVSGRELWQREIDGAGNFSGVFEEANAVAMDKDGSVAVAGVTSNEVANFRDFTVARYLPDGRTQWVEIIDGRYFKFGERGERSNPSNDIANAVAIDSKGNVIAAGSVQESDVIPSGNEPEHFHVVKIAREGGIIWSNSAAGNSVNGHAWAVSVDLSDNVIAAGDHDQKFTVTKFSGDAGDVQWLRQPFPGDDRNHSMARAVATDRARNVVAAGESLGPDQLSRFTVIKLRGTDGADYFADGTPPDVPETVVKYAPLVYLYSDDLYRPADPQTFIRRSKLVWSHQSTVVLCGGGDHEVAARGSVEAGRLGASAASPYSHSPSDHTNLLCPDRGDVSLRAYDYTRPFDGSKRDNILGELNGYMKEGFYLDPDDDPLFRRGTPSGPSVFPGAPVFYEYVEGRYVTFWFFYSYDLFQNSVSEIPLQAHEGDFEQVSIQLDANDTPVNVFYASHDDGNFVPWSLVDKYEGTHPIVFSAKGSHASYPAAGLYEVQGASVITGFDRTDRGPKWFTWSNLSRVESQPWYGFGGAWGEVGEVPAGLGLPIDGAQYTGPLGPSRYKNSRGKWVLTVSGRVTEIDGTGISGAKLTLSDAQGNTEATTYTDVNGGYSFPGLTFGRGYAVTPSKEGYGFTPVRQALPGLRLNQTVNFKALDISPPVLTLPSDIVENGDGPQGRIVYYSVTATDNVTKSPRVVCSLPSGSIFPIGVTTVTCAAEDEAGNNVVGSFKVVIRGAAEQLVSLTALVQSFALHQGTEASLLAQLEAAQHALRQGKPMTACNSLNAFNSYVRAQSGEKITMAQANQMETAANRVRAVIGCR